MKLSDIISQGLAAMVDQTMVEFGPDPLHPRPLAVVHGPPQALPAQHRPLPAWPRPERPREAGQKTTFEGCSSGSLLTSAIQIDHFLASLKHFGETWLQKVAPSPAPTGPLDPWQSLVASALVGPTKALCRKQSAAAAHSSIRRPVEPDAEPVTQVAWSSIKLF